MQNRKIKIIVLFVEPMLYGMDLIREVYEKTPYEFQYIYCEEKVTGRDVIQLPVNAVLFKGNAYQRKRLLKKIFQDFQPDFAIINGYVGYEQTIAIKYCQKWHIPYSIETDTPLHIPESKFKAILKKVYLKKLLHHECCYGFPGGTLQKENLVYYGIPDNKCYIMPMSISEKRLIEECKKVENQAELKNEYNVSEKKVILFVGRLEPEKNVSLLIHSFGELKKLDNEVVLFIIGDGSERKKLEQLAEELKIEDIYFEGYITFPKNVIYYKIADIFVLPSEYEPWGLVVNEAIIMGLPVVVSSHVGCREDLIQNGKNGYIFENNDREDLTRCLQQTLNLEIEFRMTDQWNYKQYLEGFKRAVESICRK